jgi:YVTN family beta-propeller protein
LINGRIGEIVPALFDQFTPIPVMDPSMGSFIRCIVGANNPRYLYFHEWINYTIGVVDLGLLNPHTVGTIQLDSPADDMVISPDDRFLYTAHHNDDFISVIETSAFPPSVKKVPVVNGPFALALSADGKRLFVVQTGDSAHPAGDLGTGTLSVFDTSTMQGVRVFTGKGSSAVTLNDVGTRAYVSNNQDNTVSVVDVTGAPQVIDTITGFNSPGEMCLSTNQRHLYVNQFDSPTKIAVVAI